MRGRSVFSAAVALFAAMSAGVRNWGTGRSGVPVPPLRSRPRPGTGNGASVSQRAARKVANVKRHRNHCKGGAK
jgi:hypothetical protein